MPKLCLHCMKKIPLFAGRCPHCISEDQGVHGRFILVVLLIAGFVYFAHWYTEKDSIPSHVPNVSGEVQQEVQEIREPKAPKGNAAEEELEKELRKLGAE